MSKIIEFNSEARQQLLKGVNTLAAAVGTTLGPCGRNVVIGKTHGSPHITKDGVSVAKEIELEDPIQDLGAKMILEAASKTNSDVGDSTTTATVLAAEIINEGLKYLTAGANPMAIKRGIDYAVNIVIEHIKTISKPTDLNTDIAKVATISANGDAHIGKIIKEAIDKATVDGIITIEESKTSETYVDTVDGSQFDRGYISPYFITDSGKMECVLEGCSILLYDGKIQAFQPLVGILEAIHKMGKPLLIIADDVDSEALSALVLNKMRSGLKVCAIKAPSFGQDRKDFMLDLAVTTGAHYISADYGRELNSITVNDLGRAEKVIVSKEFTTIIGGAGHKSDIDSLLNSLKEQLNNHPDNAEHIKTRISKITGGVAILYVGANTEIEMQEKKDRVEDALSATKASIKEGIVPGGGTVYVRASKLLEAVKLENYDESLGVQIIKNAICKPIKKIAENGGVDGSIVFQKVYHHQSNVFGYNARTNSFENLIETGVIDPAKAVRVALENAASIASMFLTTECVVAIKPEETPSFLPPGMPMM